MTRRCVRCNAWPDEHPVMSRITAEYSITAICPAYVRPAPWWLRAANAVLVWLVR